MMKWIMMLMVLSFMGLPDAGAEVTARQKGKGLHVVVKFFDKAVRHSSVDMWWMVSRGPMVAGSDGWATVKRSGAVVRFSPEAVKFHNKYLGTGQYMICVAQCSYDLTSGKKVPRVKVVRVKKLTR